MQPVLYSIGRYNVYSFGIFLALSFILSTFVIWKFAKEEFKEEDKGVIIDANLKTNDTRQIFYDVAKHHGLPAVVIEFICDSEKAKKRIAERSGEDGHPIDPTVYDRQKKFWQDLSLDFSDNDNSHISWVRFDTGTNKGEIIVMGNYPQEIVEDITKILEMK